MDAELVVDRLEPLSDNAFQQLVVWRVPRPLRGSTHSYKYRLALVVDRVCVLRYDNETGKGDHKHIGDAQQAIAFIDLPTLAAFDADVDRWFDEHGSR